MGFCKQIPDGNLSHVAEKKIDFPMNRRVKFVPAGQVETSSRQNDIM